MRNSYAQFGSCGISYNVSPVLAFSMQIPDRVECLVVFACWKQAQYLCVCLIFEKYWYIFQYITQNRTFTWQNMLPFIILVLIIMYTLVSGVHECTCQRSLKLTCHHINHRHFCFNIKSISVHPLLWMNVMLDFICMVFAGMWTTFR